MLMKLLLRVQIPGEIDAAGTQGFTQPCSLRDAQAHPEKHKDLIVRVAGYSAFFNVLSRATQDDIITRTEQTL